ncbi:hypothetical protein PHLCEN_2v2515 [Hermanssonia centrifuga]|uniref:Tyrosine specific protein phosphatases domain-containing protein n=1 Tax=Hermanssonia centrifuga TaxID=98765 RepID=A0A2R6RLP6_9APHY|nr:hypothetical protein PHLCEN_2v2515 [Hermanssonia centrifuga]
MSFANDINSLHLPYSRLPTPEGLAPASVTTFDEHLTRLIDAYTLQGIPVLVHCRGGVGRAGLVACCWTLKLGLCGWIDTQPDVQPQQQHTSRFSYIAPEDLPPLPPSETVRRDTLQLVERVISLVRRRRSLKVVETFEQVRFLVDYVEHLRGRAGRGVEVGSVLERNIRGP